MQHGNPVPPEDGGRPPLRRSSARAPAAPPSRAHRYLPGLDGMRALAVIAVVLFHSPLAVAPGGFLGVEVFFVISGYIITRALLAEREQRGRVSIGRFWARRARRLLPALFLLLAGVTAWSALFAPGELAGLRRDIGAALVYVTNWDLIAAGENYFATWERPSLLRHLWSLAVEEQFYLLWPPLLMGALAFGRRRGALALIVAGAAASALAMAALHEPGGGVARIYYGTDTRASGLLIGAALAFVWSAPAAVARERGRALAEGTGLALLGGAALGALTAFTLLLDGGAAFLYRGGFALTGLATAALIVAATHARSPFARLLALRPLPWLGLRSYGIYLWHWPVMALSRPGVDVPLDGAALFALQAAVTLALAEASYRWVETPIRTGALGRLRERLRERADGARWRRRAVAGALGGAAALAGTGALAFAVTTARPPEQPAYFALGGIRIQGGTGVTAALVPVAPPMSAPAEAPRADAVRARAGDAASAMEALARLAAGAARPPPAEREQAASVAALTPLFADDAGRLFRAHEAAQRDAGAPALAEAPPAEAAAATVRVTAVGDSVMLGAAHQLAADVPGIDLDASVGRQVGEVIALLRERAANGLLGDVVLLHIGNNGTFSDAQFDRIVEVAGPRRRIVFLTLKVAREWEATNNAVIARGAERHARVVVVVDWRTAALERPEVLWTDDTHLRPEGAVYYAALLAPHVTAPAAAGP